MAAILISAVPMRAQDELKGKKSDQAIKLITKDYKNWRSAGWQAKIKTEMLPVSVTMKTYMLRDSLTLISLRAPLFGEVARIEIDNRNVYVVNKMKKSYAQISLTDYGSEAAIVHSNLQDILMGRVTVIDYGTLSKSTAKNVTIYAYGDDNYLIASALPECYGSVDYGYAVDKEGKIIEFMAVKGKPHTETAPDGMESSVEDISAEASAQVAYSKSSANATLQVKFHGRSMKVSMEGMKLETGVAGFDRINLRGYQQTGLKEVMKF